MAETDIYQIAPSGDLKILLFSSADSSNNSRRAGSETHDLPPNDVPKTFIVSSAVMRLASPVWNTMLEPQGHFMKSFSNGEVHFAEDDATALLLVLRIAHLQFHQIPQVLDIHEMVSLAVVCDTYDTARLVRPWIKQWEESLKKRAIFVEGPGHEEYLFLAWTFGDLVSYEKIARRLIFNSTSNNEGQLYADGKLLGKNLPPGAIDCILEAREKTITSLLEACSALVESYESDQLVCKADSLSWNGVPHEARKQCDTLVYGSLIKGLRRLGLLPGPIRPNELPRSLVHLIHDLRSMTCFVLERDRTHVHAGCVFTNKLHATVNSIEKYVSAGIDGPLLKHMDEQAKK